MTSVDNDKNGTIKLTFGIGQGDLEKSIVINATADKVFGLKATCTALAFILSRNPISQTQKLFSASGTDDVSVMEFDPTVLPWNGDLTELSHGDSTACASTFESSDHS